MNGQIGRPKKVAIPLERLERVWVGAPQDYSSGLLVQRFEWRTLPEGGDLLFG